MRGASFRDLAGADVTESDVRRMLSQDETLFVEHKGAAPNIQLAKAVASFANQLGGWVLVNVEPGEKKRAQPIGPLHEWVTKGASAVDAVRDRLRGQIDPMPPFEAKTFAIDSDKDNLLLIRVYESADTPHILSSGAIYVRGVAQDRRSDPIYRPTPIENQHALRALVERGSASKARVNGLLKPQETLPLANDGIGLQFTHAGGGLIPISMEPLITARLAPHTLTARYVGWARSAGALDIAKDALGKLAGDNRIETNPHSQGFWLLARTASKHAPTTEGGVNLAGPARMSVDAVGLVGASTAFARRNTDDWCEPLTLRGFADRYIAPLVSAPAITLERGAMLGRVTCHLWFQRIGDLMRIEDESRMMNDPGQVPFEGEITLPAEDGEIDRLAAEAARAYGRQGGLSSFE
jgi:schlafen family protein